MGSIQTETLKLVLENESIDDVDDFIIKSNIYFSSLLSSDREV